MKAGYAVTAIDAFADVQTIAMAEQAIAVGYGSDGFAADALMTVLDSLDLSRFIGFVYGSGFEAQPALLANIAAKLPLIGNAADTVAAVKTPAVFFAALQHLHIRYPAVFASPPAAHADDYLIKFAGGSGGAHIRPAHLQACRLTDPYYYQQKIDGRPVSVLFLANQHAVEVVGFNEQWLHPSAEAPYRYGGAVSHSVLADDVKTLLTEAASKLTNAFGLIGLNSLDAMIEAHNHQVFVLEINPRLSATVDLYSDGLPNLLQWHVDVCLTHAKQKPDVMHPQDAPCKAHAIVYAEDAMDLLAPVLWPDWVSDTAPCSGKKLTIARGAPVCSVFAYAESAAAAKKLAQHRVAIIQNLLQSLHQTKVCQ